MPRVARRQRFDDGTGGGGTRGYFAGSAQFSPVALGADFWIDAGVPASITSAAGKVSAIADLTGKGRNFVQGTGANQPSTGVVNIGGRNALGFDGATSWMNTGAVAFNHPAVYTYFLVLTSTKGAGTFGIWFDTDSNTGQRQAAGEGVITVDQVGMFAGNAGSPSASAPQPVAAASWVFAFNDTASTIYKGGATFAGPGTAGAGTYNFPQRLGADNVLTAGNFYGGALGEFFGVPGAVSGATVAAFTAYAHTKWGT